MLKAANLHIKSTDMSILINFCQKVHNLSSAYKSEYTLIIAMTLEAYVNHCGLQEISAAQFSFNFFYFQHKLYCATAPFTKNLYDQLFRLIWRESTSRCRVEKFNPLMMPSQSITHELHWWNGSALAFFHLHIKKHLIIQFSGFTSYVGWACCMVLNFALRDFCSWILLLSLLLKLLILDLIWLDLSSIKYYCK